MKLKHLGDCSKTLLLAANIALVNPFIDGMSRESILALRKNMVNTHAELKIFPEDYSPLGYIYDKIKPGADWTSASFFITNPYKLVDFTYAGYTKEVGENKLKNKSIVYENGIFNEIYSGEDAEEWFSQLHRTKNTIEIRTVNAFDAGYLYAAVIRDECANIKFTRKKSNIANSPHSFSGFYHTGIYNRNNLSPPDPDARIEIKDIGKETVIYIKLWKQEPEKLSAKPDIVYILRIIP